MYHVVTSPLPVTRGPANEQQTAPNSLVAFLFHAISLILDVYKQTNTNASYYYPSTILLNHFRAIKTTADNE